jgi:beta-mannanase
MQKNSIKRILVTIISLSIGFLIIMGLSLLGEKARGPLENIFTSTGRMVRDIEEKNILSKRENKRADRLKWFIEYQNDISKLMQPSSILFGASDHHSVESYESILNLEDSLQTTFPLIHIYTAWGSSTEHQFPEKEVKTILSLGSVPIITWEPWLSAFDEKEFPGIPDVEERDKGCLKEIANGFYDKYIIKWALSAKEIQKPIFLRVAHEMNDPYRYPWGPQNNKPEDFVAAWRHIHYIFLKNGVHNIIWIWSPHQSYGYLKEYYPGDDYTDYIGSGVLNYGTVVTWSRWWSFTHLFGNYYEELSSFNKPIMITEFGSLAVGGDRTQWYSNALDSIKNEYTMVKSLIFYHISSDKTVTDKSLNWYIKDDQEVVQAIRQRINN